MRIQKFAKGFSSRLLSILLVYALLLSPVSFAQPSAYLPTNRELTKDETKWVKDTLKSLTLDEKIGQMFMADGNAIFMNRETEIYKQLEHQIKDNKVGGVLWFRSDVWTTAVLTNRLQELSELPLLISADLEMGLGMRLNDTQWWPPNMAVAATGEPKYALNQGMCTAREARAIGINWLFAPVVDVNNNPANPVINVRSYSEDPKTVSDFAAAQTFSRSRKYGDGFAHRITCRRCQQRKFKQTRTRPVSRVDWHGSKKE
jgi:Glycosyl hydrolase family 3 N terminal domain